MVYTFLGSSFLNNINLIRKISKRSFLFSTLGFALIDSYAFLTKQIPV